MDAWGSSLYLYMRICASRMAAGETSPDPASDEDKIAAFMQQMLPHHENAVNMAKIILKQVTLSLTLTLTLIKPDPEPKTTPTLTGPFGRHPVRDRGVQRGQPKLRGERGGRRDGRW